MYVLFAFISVVCWLASLIFTNQMTTGVAAIGAACWFAILARIAQQEKFQRETIQEMNSVSHDVRRALEAIQPAAGSQDERKRA